MPLDQQTRPAVAGDDDARLAFLRIDAATCARLAALHGLVQQSLPAIADEFYAFVGQWPELAAKLGAAENVARLRRTQAAHWGSLFAGRFDAAYLTRATQVGRAHERIGLEPRWYIGGYALVIERLIGVLAARHRAKPALVDDIATLLRAAFLDLDIAISTYVETGAAAQVRGEMLTLSEVLDREVHAAAGVISAKAAQLADGGTGLIAVAEDLRTASAAVATAVSTTAKAVGNVASATQELETASQEINATVERARVIAEGATDNASAASASVGALATAAEQIGGVVRLIRSIAGQTKLLALNATIEAARAGEAGRGFAVVASEVKNLARETETAITGISQQAEAIGRATAAASATVASVGARINDVTGIAQEVANATAQQRAATAGIAESIEIAARQGQDVAERSDALKERAATTEQTARNFQALAKDVSDGVAELQRRLTVILRTSAAGDRRQAERAPISLKVGLEAPGVSASGFTADLSLTGALLSIRQDEGLVGAAVTLEIERVGRVPARVVAVTGLGTHVQFSSPDPAASGAIAQIIAASRSGDAAYVARSSAMAKQIADTFAAALQRGEVNEADLFDTQYQRIPETDPRQVLSSATAICDRLLPPIIDPAKDADPAIAFCAACDVNGYIATHNREYCQPQRAGERDWNTANSRYRRIFDDRTGLLAARNLQPCLIQSYHRDMGGGRVMTLKEFDAPIMVNGRHWGALRLAVKV